jgi:methionine aminopeptidase type I
MRRAGLVVAEIHKAIRESIKPGMTTSALDTIAEAVIKRNGATSNFKGYHGFPATICVSINDEIVHGIPGDRVINDGDVVSVDCGAIVDGWHGDAAFSIGLGRIDPEDQKLMDVCEESMWRGIAAGRMVQDFPILAMQLSSTQIRRASMEFCRSTVDMESVQRCTKNHMYLILVKLEMAQRSSLALS